MESQGSRESFFDRPLVELLKPTWEKAVYATIFLVAVASRFWDLGARAMSHDESLHALYSYYLYNGTGYAHNPMMHGPFLFHANALIYFLFGDNDFTARIVPALFGVFMVMSPILLRRWLGRLGSVIASLLLLISPLFLYYSRYIRNDIYIAVWTILLIAALFHFLEDHRVKWFYLGAAVLMLSLATKEVAYIFGFIGLSFLVELVLWEKGNPRRRLWLYGGAGLLSILLLTMSVLLGRTASAGAEEAAQVARQAIKVLQAVVTVTGGTILAVLVSAPLLRSRHPRPSSVEEAVRTLSGQNWIVAIAVMFVIYTLLFTTFFTNPVGLGTGIIGSISYWLAQQEVQRGGQPWYYYLILLPMYEFVPLLFGTMAMVYYWCRRIFSSSSREDTEGTPAESRLPGSDSDMRFIAFLIFWTLTTLFIYSWAGEKMPWLGVHPALPFIILSAKFCGDLFATADWRTVWRRGGGLLALLLPLVFFGLYTLLRLQPFQGLSLSKLQATGGWLAAVMVTALLVIGVLRVARRLGGRNTVLVSLATVLTFLSFFTVRFAWMAAYINYDYATELLVYAHGGADVKPTMNEIAEISRRTVGDKMIEVAYDSDVSWPLEWYMREYPNRKFYGETPTREALNVPIVLAGDKIIAKVRPFLGDRYHCFKRRLVWWPNQQYMDLTWQRIRNILGSPQKRAILWKILYYRQYPRTPDDWYHVHNFSFCVRKDVAQQLWDFGAVPPEAYELPPDPYAEAHIDLQSVQVWGQVGTGPGQFNHPRGLALGPDGDVYVVDSDNHRVQVFGPDGSFRREWGSHCNLALGLGCVDPDGAGPLELGDGQFQEPWGIAVAQDGRVYVADTWNHRIQVFAPDGTFLTKWGTYGQTDRATWLFYGPRDIAIDASGRVFVTDTGNKRVVVFDQEGNYLDQWGSAGAGPGQFEEPVGIDLDAEGNIYVADTWNQRVQVFSPDHAFLRQWSVDAWYGESVINKPYLAVDAQGRVYITDPEGYRVAVFAGDGELVATFGLFGYDANSFSLPTGIAVDPEGFIYVTDTDGQRVMKFQPLP